jgi:signal transduction histidine kinase/CheY-like chemotaxis protein
VVEEPNAASVRGANEAEGMDKVVPQKLRSRRLLPLRVALTLPFVALFLVGASAIGWLSLDNGRRAVNDVAQQLQADVILRVNERLAAYLEIPTRVNEANAQALRSGLLRLDDPASWPRHFYGMLKTHPSIAYSFFGQPDGEFYGARRTVQGAIQVIRAGRETEGHSTYFRASELGEPLDVQHVFKNFDPRTRPWYKAAVAAKTPTWTPIYRHFVLQDLTLTASAPFYGPTGELHGVFAVDYSLAFIQNFLKTITVGKSGEVFLLERNGDLVAASSPLPVSLLGEKQGEFVRVKASECGVPLIEAAARLIEATPQGLAGLAEPVLNAFSVAGNAYYLQCAPFLDPRGVDWLVAAYAPESEFLGRIEGSRRQTVALIVVSLLLTIGVGVFVSARIARPIERLSLAADALSRGERESVALTDLCAGPCATRELDRLSRAFMEMNEQLWSSFDRLAEQHELIEQHNHTLELRVAERSAELRHMNSRLRAIFDAIPGHVHVIDRDFRVIDIGDKMLKALGLGRELVLGRKCHEVFRLLPHVCDACPLMTVEGRHGVCSRASTPQEEEFLGMAFMNYSAPVRREDGQVWGYIECLMDISELRAMERELVRAVSQAEEANRAKSDFLAKMSHEIRTPMNGILGLTALLQETSLDQEQSDHLKGILESGRSLLELINDILDFSKIEANGLELQHAHFSLSNLLDSLGHTLAPLARGKGLSFELQLDPACPPFIVGDPMRLRQILVNLLGNAIKFTSAGAVSLRVECKPGINEQELWLRFSVSDTGEGVSGEALKVIFEPFRQADDSITRRFGGTGLGLSICKQLVELMGGSIEARSELGRGSEFTFRIPAARGDENKILAVQQAAASLEELRKTQRPMRLLLAEDNPVNVKLATALLHKLGHQTSVASDGEQALELLLKEEFDAVLMDVEMPGMDGLTASALIRQGQAGERARRTPIVAVTAHAYAEFETKCLEAGMDAYLTKPLAFAEVAAILKDLRPKE